MSKRSKITLKRRRKPSIESARKTVDAIIEGTARTLVKRGYAGTTTNHIAREAGVSIGSLYEYFGNKDEVIAALIDRFADRGFSHAVRQAQLAMPMPPAEAVRFWLHGMVEFIAADAPLVRTLYQQVPFVWELPRVQGMVSQVERLGLQFADMQGVRGPATRMQDRFYVIGVAIGASIMQIATDPSTTARRRDLTDELALMLVRYLKLGGERAITGAARP